MGRSTHSLPKSCIECPCPVGHSETTSSQPRSGQLQPADDPVVGISTESSEAIGISAENSESETEANDNASLECLPHTAHDDEPEFELWVEAEIENQWCLDEPGPCSDRPAYRTPVLRRRWEDFEELVAPSSRSRHGQDASLPSNSIQSLRTLGLTEGADAKAIRSAFRRQSRSCHPDKPEGSKEAFHTLVKAYHTASNFTGEANLVKSCGSHR